MTTPARGEREGPRFGLYVPQFRMDFTQVRDLAVTADAYGFDSLWVMDHLLVPGAAPTDVLESWTLLSALATATERIRLGHLVGCNPLRPPALLAKMAATLDRISGGRFDLGLGWGSVTDELTAFGYPPRDNARRAAELAETLEICAKMWTGEPFDHDGPAYTLRGAYGLPTPVQGRIPVHIGGAGRRLTMPLVSRHADWWNCLGSARHRLDELAPLRGGARISAQYAVGLVAPGEDPGKVAAQVARRMPRESWGEPLVGTPDRLAELFCQEWERGVELFVVRLHAPRSAEAVAHFAFAVAAEVRARTGYAAAPRTRAPAPGERVSIPNDPGTRRT
ncbi:LLM class flavin-dependent oxidoreductase [Streptomyces sp. NPDC001255]|uniref:LLM class flavin-dependent oxidoreductase n=1 Tax=Streptomyces sp. NPDC001255 TaxID=3364550 RepID=UPI00367DCC50